MQKVTIFTKDGNDIRARPLKLFKSIKIEPPIFKCGEEFICKNRKEAKYLKEYFEQDENNLIRIETIKAKKGRKKKNV